MSGERMPVVGDEFLTRTAVTVVDETTDQEPVVVEDEQPEEVGS